MTSRTIQGRCLLRPSKRLNTLVLGVLARAARLYEMRVCAFSFLSNHYHLLLRPRSAVQVARFMNYLNGNLAKEVGRLHGWRAKFWGGRYRAIPVSSEPAAQVGRLRYVLEQGCKEGLVARPEDWPGAHCAAALLVGAPVEGVWVDRTAFYRARQDKKEVRERDFLIHEILFLSPLPCWEEASSTWSSEAVGAMVKAIAAETAERFRRTGTGPLGRRAILRQNPRRPTPLPKRPPAPLFHAATRAVRRHLIDLYRSYLFQRAAAVTAIRTAVGVVWAPSYGIPPPLA